MACALAIFFPYCASAQKVSRASCGADGKAHIIYSDNSEKIVDAQKGQVGCEHLIIESDDSTVAWSVLVKNCCTSYPIPTRIIVYRKGKQKMISPGQMIWDWRFIDGGKRLAVLSGPVHGDPSSAILYNTHNVRVLAKWEGQGTAPYWASAWRTEFPEGQSRGRDKNLGNADF